MPKRARSAAAARSKPSALAAPARLAAIDIGSNSIHMVVAEALPRGGFRVLDREREMVRLGKSALGKQRRLSERAMRDGLVALAKMTTLARLKGAERLLAVATSAVREASNGEEFLARVRAQTGLDARVLSGEEEGRLIFRAVREAVDLARGSSVVVDVGGGSTEWINARHGKIGRVASLPLGSLRCATALTADPPSRTEVAKLRRDLRLQLQRLRVPKSVERMIATSGTAVCLADLVDLRRGAEGKTSGGVLREVRWRELSAMVAYLRRLRRRQLAALAPVGKPRSESVLAGAILLEELVRHAGVDRFYVSDRALREGLVLEALGADPIRQAVAEDVRRRQVVQLAERAEAVHAHGAETARLAVRLFDLTRSLHGLAAREREWLEYAALLHDLGYLIDYEQHQHHGYYLVKNASLDAFDPREIEILAHLVRYHRGAGPKPRHPTMAPLRAWQQKVIEKLTPLLRIADALDRSHARRVKEIYCAISKSRVRLELISRYRVDLELDAARGHAKLFERVYGSKLRLRQGLEQSR